MSYLQAWGWNELSVTRSTAFESASGVCVCVCWKWRSQFDFLADAGAQQCQKLIRLNYLQIKSITVPWDCVITADYLRSKGSNIIEEDITPQWDMNI